MNEFPRLTPADLRDIAHALHGSADGAIEALSHRLRVSSDLLKAWCDATAAIPDHLEASLFTAIGGTTLPDTAWRRDEWILARGDVHSEPYRHLYLLHLWPPRFRSRVIEVFIDTATPLPHEHPADVESGIVYPAADNLRIAEIEWQDPPPAPQHLIYLLHAATVALHDLADT